MTAKPQLAIHVLARPTLRRCQPLLSPPPNVIFSDALARLQRLLDGQRDALDRAAALCTEAIAADGLVHLFGCGHSRMMCEEMTPRQGCFVGWHTIVELGLTFHNLIVGPNGLRQSLHLEKTPGYAEQILRNFAFGPKDVLIVISTSGIREVIIEMAEGPRQRGATELLLAKLQQRASRRARADRTRQIAGGGRGPPRLRPSSSEQNTLLTSIRDSWGRGAGAHALEMTHPMLRPAARFLP